MSKNDVLGHVLKRRLRTFSLYHLNMNLIAHHNQLKSSFCTLQNELESLHTSWRGARAILNLNDSVFWRYKSLTSTGMNFSAVRRYFLMKFSGNLLKGLNRGTCKDFGDRERGSGFFWWLKMVKNTGELWYFEFYKSYTSTGMNFSAVSG